MTTLKVDPSIMPRDEYDRLCRVMEHREAAQKLGVSEGDLWRIKNELEAAWKSSGGFKGAIARLRFADKFLSMREKNVMFPTRKGTCKKQKPWKWWEKG